MPVNGWTHDRYVGHVSTKYLARVGAKTC